MNEKINMQGLVTLFAEKSGITKKEAEFFLKEFFSVTHEGLINDKIVKVKNLGNFKLIVVDDRESIDITNGDRVLIPTHYKVSYSPDTQLAETVNEPFSLFEIIEVRHEAGKLEHIRKARVGMSVEKPVETVPIQKPIIEKLIIEPREEDIQEPVIEEIIQEPIIEKITQEPMEEKITRKMDEEDLTIEKTVTESIPNPSAELVRETVEEPQKKLDLIDEEQEEELFFIPEADPYEDLIVQETLRMQASENEFTFAIKEKALNEEFKGEEMPLAESPPTIVKRKFSKIIKQKKEAIREDKKTFYEWLIFLLIVLVIAGVYLYFEREERLQAEYVNNFLFQFANHQEREPETTGRMAPEILLREREKPPVSADTIVNKAITKSDIDNTVKKRRITAGERLTLIALKEYGHKSFWVYIYQENKDKIRNPDNVPVGTELVIPPASKYGIDKSSRESIQKADELALQLMRR
jgi:nucleoid DNA-binding protein/nucleoid-associated protein YgaU